MSAAEDTEMQLQVVVGSHGVGAMDFGSSKEVPVTAFVSAEKLSARKGSPYFAHAFHVEGALKKCNVFVKWQHEATGNAGVLGI